MITPLGDLHAQVVATGYSDEEIDQSFSSLVDADGRVLGVSVQLSDLSSAWREKLLRAGLASENADSRLELTRKGETMLRLLYAYADEHQVWRSNIHDR